MPLLSMSHLIKRLSLVIKDQLFYSFIIAFLFITCDELEVMIFEGSQVIIIFLLTLLFFYEVSQIDICICYSIILCTSFVHRMH